MGFNLDDLGFDFNINDDSGDIDIVQGKPKVQSELETPVVQQPDRYAELDNRFVNMEQQIANQNKTLNLIAQYLGTSNQVQEERQVEATDDDVLGEIFQDVDKGKLFINNLVAKVTQQVEARINPMIQSLNPIISESAATAEVRQFAAAHPDFQEYVPAMKFLLEKLPDANLSAQQLYNAAKSMGLKQAAPQQQRQNSNVTNINRQLPDRLDSSNAQLNNKKEPSNVREAFDQALEEMGMAG